MKNVEIRKVHVTWCPIRERICSRDEEEILTGRRGLCLVDTSTSDCPAARQGMPVQTIEGMVVDGEIVLTKKALLKMLLRRIQDTIEEIEHYLEEHD